MHRQPASRVLTVLYQKLVFPVLRHADAETAHHASLALLRCVQALPPITALLVRHYSVRDPRLHVTRFGIDFANPVGLAAGFDKDGVAPAALTALGYGHVEVGTVTPRPQAGRGRPRIFRLVEDGAVVNRLGFPSDGMAVVARRLRGCRERGYVLGVNVGPNASSVGGGTAIADFLSGISTMAPHADYLTINVSSPNTPGLRGFQSARVLDDLLRVIFASPAPPSRPLLLKIAPDLDDAQLDALLSVALAHPVAGIVATNTTVSRPATLVGAARHESGGLSGPPLRSCSTRIIRSIRRRTDGRLPIIGVGGIATPADAVEKLCAGASLLQLYTGMVYQGPALARWINLGLLAYLAREGLPSVEHLIGQDA